MSISNMQSLVSTLQSADLDPLVFGNNIETHKYENIIVKKSLTPSELKYYRNRKFICLCTEPIKPLYYGIFISIKELPMISDMQDTALHITCYFISGKKEIPDYFSEYIGARIPISIIGISFNQSGMCFIVEKNHRLLNDVERPHITLYTKPGARAADVGKNAINPIMFKEPFVVHGIFTPMF